MPSFQIKFQLLFNFFLKCALRASQTQVNTNAI